MSVKKARNANIVMISALSKKKKPILIFTQIQDQKLVKCRTLSSLASISLKLLKGVCMVSIGCVQIMEMTANIGICCRKATFCRRKILNKVSLQMKKKNWQWKNKLSSNGQPFLPQVSHQLQKKVLRHGKKLKKPRNRLS